MALTREQFDELRSKGLSVEQIVKFEKGEQTQQPIKQSGGFIGNVGRKLQERGREFVSEISKASTGDLASTKLGTIGRGTLRTGSLIGGGLGDILIEGVKAILPEKAEQKIKEGISNVASKELPQKVIQSISSWAEKNPTAAKDLEGALEIAGIFPIVKGGKVAGKAAIQTGKEVAGDIGRVAGKTLATTGAITEKAGKSLVSATFPPTASQAKSILGYKATTPLLKRVQLAAKSAEKAPITPSEVALKYNLVGLSRSEIGAKAKRVANQLFENQVNPVINGIEKVVKPKEIFDRVKKTISKTADTSKKKSLINALDSLKDDYKNVSRLSYKKLDQIKSEMAKGLPAKVWKGQDIAGELNNVRKMFSDEARKLIRKELPDNVKRIYDEYGSLLSIMEKGEKSLQRGLDVGILGLTSEAIRRGATPLTTIGGKAINKAGEIIKGVGQKLQKGSTKLKSSGEKGSLLNIKPGLTIEDISKKGKGKILKTTPLKSKTDNIIKEAKKYKSADEFIKAQETRTGAEVRDKIGTKLQDPYTAKYLPTNNDGTITLYHSTTKEGAEKIKQSGLTGSKTEGGDIYFTTNKNGYGGIGKGKDEVLAFNIDPKKIKFDDVYRGELHLKGNNTDIGGIKPIEIKTKSQLTDIWNKAQKIEPKKVLPKLKKETASIKTISEKTKPLPKGKGKILKTNPLVKSTTITGQPREFAKNINGEYKNIETRAFAKIDKQGKNILQDYKSKNNNYVNTDDFRKYFKNEGYAGFNSAAVQEPSSELSKLAFTNALKNNGKDAIFYAGSSGSGKTSAIKGIDKFTDVIDNAAVILDSNLSSYDSAIKKIEEAVLAGKKTPILYTYREVDDAFVNGIVKRMLTNASEGGRIVPTKVLSSNAIGSWNTVSRLHKEKFPVYFIDNSLGKGKQQLISFKNMSNKINYPPEKQLTDRLNKLTKKLYEDGKINKEQYQAYIK